MPRYVVLDGKANRALELIRSGRLTIPEASRNSGIPQSTLYYWAKKFEIKPDDARMRLAKRIWEKRK